MGRMMRTALVLGTLCILALTSAATMVNSASATTTDAVSLPADSGMIQFTDKGTTRRGQWIADITATPSTWAPGLPLQIQANLTLSPRLIDSFAVTTAPVEEIVLLVTAERTFDADGILRFASDEQMSTLLTPTGLPIEGGVQGAVTNRYGYGYDFRTPVDELVTVPLTATKTSEFGRQAAFKLSTNLPDDLPPGLYRLRFDYGVIIKQQSYNLDGTAFAKRSSTEGRFPEGPCDSESYSPLIAASAKHVSGRLVDASAIKPRIPWVLLGNYNSNGYRGVVAIQDQARFGLSSRNLIQDDVILPLYDGNNPENTLAYNLEPQFPTDTIDPRRNIPWDYSKGELSIQITHPDGKVIDLGTWPFVGAASQFPTTKKAAITQWKPPMYGQYTVKATGWTADIWGNRYEGGGTFKFWVAKRMTLATATFQGQSYPVGNRYGRDIGFAPAVPADVEVTASLYVNSDPKQVKTISYKGKASAGGVYGSAQGMPAFPFEAPGEYVAAVLATYKDPDGHLWVESMRHAGVIYPEDTPIAAHGKKFQAGQNLVDRGEEKAEAYRDLYIGEGWFDWHNFPYQAGDVLLIASDGSGANNIVPVLTWTSKSGPAPYDPAIQDLGRSNIRLQTSNGYSPHLFPEYITDWAYYYASAPRPGMMGRFIVAEDGTRSPHWPTSNHDFGGQINATRNGDIPGDIYRLLGGVVVRPKDKAPIYAGYMATAMILPKHTMNNRVIAPGAEEIEGPTGAKSRVFLAMNARPGMVYDTGTTFAPALQVDPMVPISITFTLAYPDGHTVQALGLADATGSFAGKERWTLDQPGVYRYTINSNWNGFSGLVPGLPKDGGEFYVVEKERPAGAKGLTFDLPPLSKFDPVKGTKFVGTSTAKVVHYAVVMPGAVLMQGTLPVVGGKFEFVFDPAAINAIARTYEITNIVTEKPELGDVVQLTFFSEETLPNIYHSFVRLVLRGNVVNYTRQ